MKKYTTLGKKKIGILTFAVILSLQIASCEKDVESQREYPRIKTLDVVNIDNSGATFRGEIVSQGNCPVEKYGFVWGTKENLSVNTHDFIETANGNADIYFELRAGRVMEAHKDYYVRAFVKVNEKVIYGDVVSFVSLGSEAPEIYGFEPRNAAWGDTVYIRGKNFSNVTAQTSIYFGETKLAANEFVEKPNDSLIVASVPFGLSKKECAISVDVIGNSRQFNKYPFTLILPTLTDFSPKAARWGDSLTIVGTNIYNPILSIKIGSAAVTTIRHKGRSLVKFVLPDDLGKLENTLSMSFGEITLNATESLKLLPPKIDSIVPPEASWGEEVVIYGNFHRIKSLSKIHFNASEATVVRHSRDSIKVTVPSDIVSQSQQGEVSIVYKANDIEAEHADGFVLKGPRIESFSPLNGRSFNEVILKGSFNTEHTKLFLGDVLLNTTSVSSSSITAIIPSESNFQSNKNRFKVAVGNSQTESQLEFTIANPKIIDFSPLEATFGDTITIIGKNFATGDESNIVTFSNMCTLPVVLANDTMVKVIVPEDTDSSPRYLSLNVKSNGVVHSDNAAYSDKAFTLLKPEIISISPNSGPGNETITIKGNFFNPSVENNLIFLGGRYLYPKSASKNQLIVDIPPLYRDEYQIKLFMNGYEVTSPQLYVCSTPWRKLTTPSYWDVGNLVVIQNMAYIYFNYYHNPTIYRYNPVDNSWVNIAVPNNNKKNISVFQNDGKIYFVGGAEENYTTGARTLYETVESFDPVNNNWNTLEDFPGGAIFGSFSFTIGDKSYIVGGIKQVGSISNEVWEFNGKTMEWIQKNNIPFSSSNHYSINLSFVFEKKGYVFDTERKHLWEYNPELDHWSRKKDFPGTSRIYATSFVLNDYVYFGTGTGDILDNLDNNDFWTYNPKTDEWEEKSSLPFSQRYSCFGFAINNKGYIGFGRRSGYGYELFYELYEYDPTLEP